MKRTIKLKKKGVIHLKDIKEDLLLEGKSDQCPQWGDIAYTYLHSCDTCVELFPRVAGNVFCPCHKYTPKYLIKRLNEIIKSNKVPK